MELLFLSVDFPLPADRGFRVRTLSQLRLLAGMPAIESITLLSLHNLPVDPAHVDALAQEVPRLRIEAPVFQPIHMRRHPRTLPRLARLRFVQGVPYLVGKCDTASMRARIREALQARRYDVVYLGALGMAAYLDDVRRHAPHAHVVLEQHNVEWEIFARLAEHVAPRWRPLLHWEARALRRYEAHALQAVDAVIAISATDAGHFRQLSGVEATVVSPVVAPAQAPRSQTGAPSLVYVGVLAWQPNVQGLDWFCRDVWPQVLAAEPQATLTIAGGGLPVDADGRPIMPDGWRKPGIRAVGYVEDLETVYRDSTALIAPVIGGSGVRMKLLEAFRAGMPTVTTTDGAAGLDVRHETELLVGDSASDFAAATIRLLRDEALRQRLRAAAQQYLATHHSAAAGRARLATALRLPSDSPPVAPVAPEPTGARLPAPPW